MIFPVMIHAAMIFPVMILAAKIFPQAGLATAFHVPKVSFVTKNAPSPLPSAATLGAGFVAPSQNVNSLKGSLSPNFCPLFAPFLSPRVNTSLVRPL